MEYFNEEYSKQLLSKEWLVRIENTSSNAYLFKFCVLPEDNACCFLITDTKTVWAEVLSRKQVFRRWRQYNAEFHTDSSEEQSSRVLSLLETVHTYGGVASASFDVVKSREADLAFDLDFDDFKWHWETYFVGPKLSAEIISQHLVMPLLSVTHLAFASADPVSELSDTDLEAAVDKLGRTARRAYDIHVKHTVSKPRITTSLQRISAMLDFAPTLPAVKSEPDELDIDQRIALLRGSKIDEDKDFTGRSVAPVNGSHSAFKPSVQAQNAEPHVLTATAGQRDDSVTEDSDVEMEIQAQVNPGSNKAPLSVPPTRNRPSPLHEDESIEKTLSSSRRVQNESTNMESPSRSISSSPPAPLSKRARTKVIALQITSDSDSDARNEPSDSRTAAKGTSAGPTESQSSQESHGGRGAAAAASTGGLRTVRQPIKRGGKRF